MTTWVPDLSAYAGPRYKAIAAAIADDIARGRLVPGSRLPTHRELADRLGVTVGTITRAYAEATSAGHLEATVGRGTFVRETRRTTSRMIELGPPEVVDLAINRPAFGPHADALAQTLAELSRADLSGFLGYAPSTGALPHRTAGVRFLAMLGVESDVDEVIIACGAQNALSSIIAGVTEPGDRMVTEWLGYPGIHAAAEHHRLRVTGLPIDAEGLIPEAFELACREERPRLLACVPTLHNPTATTMSESRRRAIARIAREFDVTILEDDVYGFLVDERPRPIAAFAPERTCYVTCTSKSLVPGLRIGYVRAPRSMVDRIALAMRTTVWMAPPLMAEVVSRWIEDGTAAELMAWQRREATARQAVASRILGRFEPSAHRSAFHLFLPLPPPWRVGAFTAAMRERGVAVAPSESFVVGRAPAPLAVRLCVMSPPDRDALERALAVVADVLDHPPSLPIATM